MPANQGRVLLYIVRLLLEEDDLGRELLKNPGNYIADKKNRKAVMACVSQILDDVIIDLNAELEQVGEDFDYRGKLRDEPWVKALALRIVADYRKLVARKRIISFADEFKKAISPGKP